MIDQINRNSERHIITIEDPLEFVHENKKSLIDTEGDRHTRKEFRRRFASGFQGRS